MEELTPKRRGILDFIADHISDKGYGPTVREIVKACRISGTAMAGYHLDILEKYGYIRRDPATARSIRLGHRAPMGAEVPLMGTIAAGEPIPVPPADSLAMIEETVQVPRDLLRGRENIFALRVKGTSMIDALVDDGDIVILQQTPTAEDGQMVAAWLTDREEATLKRLYREPDRIRLQPANESMAPIYLDPDEVQVQGRVIAVIRRLDDRPHRVAW